jgi:hypothetical protein
MLITKLKATLFILIFGCPIPVIATTVIVIATPHGMVVASDSKLFTVRTLGSDTSRIGEGVTRKFVIVRGRIVVVSIGHADIKGGSAHYNFLEWMDKLQTSLPDNVPVDGVASAIESESAKVFSTFTPVLQSGAIQRDDPTETCTPFIQYVIAGYQEGVPRITMVQLYVNWDDKNLIGPKQIRLEPDARIKGNFHIHYFGIREALTSLLNRQSYAYKQAMLGCPQGFGKLMANKDISLDDTLSLASTLVEVEEKISPDDVGGDTQAVRILPNGRAYNVVNDLPKTKRVANKKQK